VAPSAAQGQHNCQETKLLQSLIEHIHVCEHTVTRK